MDKQKVIGYCNTIIDLCSGLDDISSKDQKGSKYQKKLIYMLFKLDTNTKLLVKEIDSLFYD